MELIFDISGQCINQYAKLKASGWIPLATDSVVGCTLKQMCQLITEMYSDQFSILLLYSAMEEVYAWVGKMLPAVNVQHQD